MITELVFRIVQAVKLAKWEEDSENAKKQGTTASTAPSFVPISIRGETKTVPMPFQGLCETCRSIRLVATTSIQCNKVGVCD